VNEKDILLFVELKKLKPAQVLAGLRLFRQIEIDQKLLADKKINPKNKFHKIIDQLMTEN